jgi:hypothetical protein
MGALDHVQIYKPDKSILRIDYRPRKESDCIEFLLRSDAHHDNAHTDIDMERRHLEEARKREALILDNGDCHCAMQGKWDRRADRSALRSEYQYGNYLDRLVDEAVKFYTPYARNWCMMGLGNHETSILKHHESNLTERTVEKLKGLGAVNLHTCGYAGWIRLVISAPNTRRIGSLWMYHHHGYGGGGPVTRGTIQTARMAVYLPDADIVWTGHTHDQWIVPIERYRITTGDRTYLDRQTHARTPGYKDEFSPQEGWHTERGGAPKPRGALWLRAWLTNKGIVEYELTEAR